MRVLVCMYGMLEPLCHPCLMCYVCGLPSGTNPVELAKRNERVATKQWPVQWVTYR